MSAPLVSVLMPAYNCEKFVQQAIDSILGQTYKNIELLIADDYSKDATKSIIDSYSDPRIKRFHNEKNLGYLKASNKLFGKCSGELITFQDADDYADPSRIEKLVQFLNGNSTVSVVGSNVIKVNEDGELKSQSNFPLEHNKIMESFRNYRNVFTGSALMVRKGVIEKYGVYNEYFDRIGSEDIYWFSHIIEGLKVANLPEALYYYRFNSNSVTLNHKNPKAFVGHDLILFLYRQRQKGKEDFIASGNWKKADLCCRFLTIIKNKQENKAGAFGKFFLEGLKHPVMASLFARQFISQS